MGSTAKRTKAVVNQHLKVMYNNMKDSGTLGDSDIGIIMTLAADKYGEDSLTIENTGLYALGHELGKAFKSGLKP
jgi:ribulose-5-phosphate 4-epimerase/fuculose-1-phosphate aldolase